MEPTSWKDRLRLTLLALGAWVTVSLLFAVQSAVRMNVPVRKISLYSFAAWLPVLLFSPAIGAVARRYRFRDREWGASMAAHALMMLAFCIIGAAMMGALEWLIPGDIAPPMTLRAAMIRAIPAYMAIDVLTYVMIAAAFLAAAYSRESRQRELFAAGLSAELAQARMQVLSSQLQPHFLFNTLNGISALVREDPKKAEQLIARLSELLRHSLDDESPGEITLGEELKLLSKYLEIQEARFGERLRVTRKIDADALAVRVPTLLLQPLVENAIRHAVASRAAGGEIEIFASVSAGVLTIRVGDDGPGPGGESLAGRGLGLSITRARLKQLGGSEADLALDSRAAGGTVCTISLPLTR